MQDLTITLGGNEQKNVKLLGRMANRHGLIAGATGTGKTVSLQVMAEGFSKIGVPVFMADIKGDLSGLAKPGAMNDKIQKRLDLLNITQYGNRPFPTVFWDLFGKHGHPIRATVTDMGPTLLSALLDLNETQTAVMYAIFRVADDQGLLILDLKDLQSMVRWVGDNAKELRDDYGSIPTQSINAIQRALLVLEEHGGDQFFGEPSLELKDLMQVDFSGNGVVSILDATDLIHQPRLYSMFLLWLLSELFEQMPEVGDQPKPKMVFFFDEAHLLFKSAPKALLEKIEQVVRLIRSKGVGIYFISQSPLDIPESVLGQLGNRVQHALRAFTPKDQKAVKVAAQTFRANPSLDTEETISHLGVGEALVSVLDEQGIPTPVEKVLITPPESRIGPMQAQERSEQISRSPFNGKYNNVIDRESAYELLKERSEHLMAQKQNAAMQTQKPQLRREREPESVVETLAKSAARAVGSQLGRQIVRGVLGSLFGGRR